MTLQPRGDRVPERVGDVGAVVGDCDGLLEPIDDVAVAVEDVIGLDAERRARHVGGDSRMSVTVGTDPGAPAQERLGNRLARAAAVLAAAVEERGVEGAVQLRRDAEQRLVEKDHRRAHLVERGRPLVPALGGLPQDGDLFPQASPQVAVLAPGQARIVEPVEQPIQTPLRDEHGPPPRLGGMGGEHRSQLKAFQESAQLIGFHLGAGELVDRIGDRLGEGARPFTATKRSDAMLLLGEVDEQEVGGEGAGHRQELVDRPSGEGRIGFEGARSVGGATANGGPPQGLDELEELGAFLFDDHLSQEGTQEFHLAGERVPGAGAADASRLGSARAVGSSRSRHAVLRLSRGPRRHLRSAAARRRPRYSLVRRGPRWARNATRCRRRGGRAGSHRRRR